MDRLFVSFLNEVEKFIKLAETAPDNLTDEAVRDGDLTQERLQAWNKMIKKVKQAHIALNSQFNSVVDKKNLNLINSELNVFRSLSRWLDEIPCVWSENYLAINNCLDKIYYLNDKIDEEYHLEPFKKL